MKIVALDSSGMTASVAIASPDLVIAEYSVTYKKTHSQTLVPMLDEICRMAQLSPDEIEAIAVAGGPGSFTGLRIGSATAKGLALAWNKPILSVPTLEGLACRYIGTDRLVCPMMDARREQVYTGLYRFADKKPGYTGLQIIYEQDALPVEEILEKINETGERVQFLGDGVKVYAETIQNMTKVDYQFAPASQNLQSAGCIAMRAFDLLQDHKAENGWMHRPDYLRKSQAEREREKRGEKDFSALIS